MQVNSRTKLLSFCIVLVGLLSVIACKPNDQSELYGTYIADYDVAKEKLTLNQDGTFIQEVTLKTTKRVDITRGTWTYDSKTGYVRFHDSFMSILNGFGELNPNYNRNLGSSSLPAVKHFGSIKIEFSEGKYYKKVD